MNESLVSVIARVGIVRKAAALRGVTAEDMAAEIAPKIWRVRGALPIRDDVDAAYRMLGAIKAAALDAAWASV